MEKIVYDNGKFCVFQYSYEKLYVPLTAYGIRRTDRPQDGMIFSHTNLDYCKKIADDYKKQLLTDRK